MTTKLTSETREIKGFIASKQIKFFQDLKQQHFSGQVIFKDWSTEWVFILYLGRIIYVQGGKHPVRRWRRNLAYYFPQIAFQLQKELSSFEAKLEAKIITEIATSWDYYLLYLWLEQEKIDREQATKMIRAMMTEVLFDITQAGNLVCQLIPQAEIWEQRFVMIDAEQQIIDAWKLWQEWQNTKLAQFSPNLAPKVKYPEKLKAKTSTKTYQALTKLLEGKDSLRDLAIRKQTGLLLAARSISPYTQLGYIELLEIADLPIPIKYLQAKAEATAANVTPTVSHSGRNLRASQSDLSHETQLTIAYIETNSVVCQIMKKIITNAGYNFIAQSDPFQAIAVLLENKPDIIFINLELSQFNGYDLCSELRQLPYFKNIPIIMFGKNINLVDRVKAKMAGCSELFDRPLEARSVLSTITKYCFKNSPDSD